MKIRLGRGATLAAGAVAASLFILLCMMFYGKEDYLSPERILARGDALRFRIASLFVEPFGAGAYLAFGLAFLWSVVAYFRDSAGSMLPRAVGAAACIPSFCALTSLAAGRHEFWAGSVGTWMGDLVYRGMGPAMAWGVLGTLFLVSFALATQFGFYTQFASLRGSLAFPLLPPEEAAPGESSATAVLEPGAAEPVESWLVPDAPGGFELPAPGFATEEPAPAPAPAPAPVQIPDSLPPDLLDEVFPLEDDSEAGLIDRDVHLADIRRRLASGEEVTDVERRLVQSSDAQAETGAAIDALFEPSAPAPAPAASYPMPDLPPFLLANAAPPLLSQSVVVDGPALPSPVVAVPPAEEPAPAPTKVKLETEEFDGPAGPVAPQGRAPYIFAGVEFLPPNEELAGSLEDAPAPAAPAPEAPLADMPFAMEGTFGHAAEAVSAEPAAAAPASDAAPAPSPAPAGSFEDEFFAFGLDAGAAVEAPAPVEPAAPIPAESAHAAAAAFVMASPTAEPERASVPGDVFAAAAPTPVAEEPAAAPAPVEESHGATAGAVFQAPVEDDGAWLLAAAKDLGLEPVVEDPVVEEPVPYVMPAPEPSAEPEPEPFVDPTPSIEVTPNVEIPAVDSHPDAVLARLFGDPVARRETEEAPPGPAQQEPREPPANLMPVIDQVEERVTLLTDPVLGDCLKDHGIHVDEVVSLPPGIVVEDDAPKAEEDEAAGEGTEVPERGISAESAAEAIVASFQDLFGEETPAAPSPVVPHGWGTLHPIQAAEAAAVEGPGADAGPRTPVHAPPPVDEASAEAPPTPDVPPVEEFEEPAVDQVLVNQLIEEFRPAEVVEEPAPTAPAPAPAEETAPAAAPAARSDRDELYGRAVEAVKERGRGSVVVLQRKLSIGFTRASKILAQLVEDGILGAENASGSHPVL